MNDIIFSHFATQKEILCKRYRTIWKDINYIHSSLNLPDHSEVNRTRYPWSKNMLTKPEMYASRMWEYPFALISSNIKAGDYCLDVGCGMSAFTIYLMDKIKAKVVGTDPDFFKKGVKYKGHGVSEEFLKKTRLKIVKGKMEKLPFKSNSFDEVYCLSVIEHVSEDVGYLGIQEMARVLKPEGILVLTVDTNLKSNLVAPLNLIWNSGLIPVGKIDVKWPRNRLGIFANFKEPADIYGIVLKKDNYIVQNKYSASPRKTHEVEAYKTPLYRYYKHSFLFGIKLIWRSIYYQIEKIKNVLVK